MRTTLLVSGLVAAGLLAAALSVERDAPLPAISLGVEEVCVEAMRRSAPDLSWDVQGREETIGGRAIRIVPLRDLPSHHGSLVRVAGVLHVDYEWVALYPSRAAMDEMRTRAPWVSLGSLWPDGPYWRTKGQGPTASDRCVVVEGTYWDGGRHRGTFTGTIADVLRPEVWSTPHRPFDTSPPAPPALIGPAH